MNDFTFIIILSISSGIIILLIRYFYKLWIHNLQDQIKTRNTFILNYKFPIPIRERIQKQLGIRDPNNFEEVLLALKEYFCIFNESIFLSVTLPSDLVFSAWKEFFELKEFYQEFSTNAFSEILHPPISIERDIHRNSDSGLRRTWELSCKRENINPDNPERIPILFSIDKKLNWVVIHNFQNGANEFGHQENHSESSESSSSGSEFIAYGFIADQILDEEGTDNNDSDSGTDGDGDGGD